MNKSSELLEVLAELKQCNEALIKISGWLSEMLTAEEKQEEKGIPLEFINSSGSEINGIFLSETGRNIWSENLLKDTSLKNGENAGLDIKRESILGLTDIKIIYSSGKERIWKKLPILEIFEITNKKNGEPGYERIKPGA